MNVILLDHLVKNVKNMADIASAKQMLLGDNAINVLLELLDFRHLVANRVIAIVLEQKIMSVIWLPVNVIVNQTLMGESVINVKSGIGTSPTASLVTAMDTQLLVIQELESV